MAYSSTTEPMCIFSADPKLGLRTFKASELERCLELFEELKNLKVVVLSVAGRFRQGKSFMLNFLIKYLRAGGNSDWLDDNDELDGFDWRNTRKRVTQGVLLWPEVFKMRRSNGEEVAVLLMDTQGVFDTGTTVKECTGIFSFSVLLSSTQIFNIKQNIQGDDLSQLELFTKYGQLVASLRGRETTESPSSHTTPFQDLVFLVRDWSYPDEDPYGWEGGNTVLNEELNKRGLTGELHSMRQNIKNSFSTTRCYLMPYPGEVVASSKNFRGCITDIRPEFVQHVRTFVESLLEPDNLIPKRLNGEEVTLRDFLVHVETYAKVLGSNSLPTPSTLYEAMVTATNNALFQRCSDLYHSEMTGKVKEDTPLDVESFDEVHHQASNKSRELCKSSLKMGEPKQIDELSEKLEEKIESMAANFRLLNDAALTKLRTETEFARLNAEQERLQEEVKKSGELTKEINDQLDRIQGDKDRLQKEHADAIKQAQKAIEEANARRGVFSNILGSVGEFVDGIAGNIGRIFSPDGPLGQFAALGQKKLFTG